MAEFTIQVRLDIEKDARNYRSAFNKNTHSAKRKEQVEQTTSIDLQQLQGMEEENAYPFLREYLEDFWKSHKDEANKKIIEMQSAFDTNKNAIFAKMEQLTHRPIYRNDFTIFLTSLNRGPYNVSLGQTRSHIHRSWVCKAFIHELLHFQTIHYYKEYIISKVHDEKKFEDLKEALTFLLNHEFSDIIENPDQWYPQHQELRKKLEAYRVDSDKDFEKLIEYWCEILCKNQ